MFLSEKELLSIVRTFEFSILSVTVEIILGVIIGQFLSKLPDKKNYFQILFILPIIIPSIICGMIWRSIFDQSYGIANQVLDSMGFKGVSWFSLKSPQIVNEKVGRILNINPGYFSALITEIWQWTPFIAVIVSASLKSMPIELIDWVKTKSPSRIKKIKILYIPYLKNILIIVFLIRFIDSFKTYEILWSFFGGNVDTASISIRIATYVLEVRNYSSGASLSIIILLLMLPTLYFSFLLFKNKISPHFKKWE